MCYAVVSFGGFREFGWVPRFLWKGADILLLNDARSILSDVFNHPDVPITDNCRTGTTKWSVASFEDNDDGAGDSNDNRMPSDKAKGAAGGLDSHESAAGACLDNILGQLLRPKIRLQYKQHLGATTATARLRSRARKPRNASEQPNMSPQNYTASAWDRDAPCWKKLDHAKQQQGQAKSAVEASLSPIVVYDLQGAAMDIPERAMTPPSGCPTRTSRSPGLQEGAKKHHHQTQKNKSQGCVHLDSLAMIITESVTSLHAPQAEKTAVLPEGARPSMWGLPVSLLMLRHIPQHPPLSEVQPVEAWRSLPATLLPDYAGKLLLQCANSCCRVPLGHAGDLKRVSRRHPLADGPPWAKLAFKYFLEELASSTIASAESGLPSRRTSVGRYVPESVPGRGTSVQSNFGSPVTTLENTLLEWLQETELLRPEGVMEIRTDTEPAKERELWVMNTAKVLQRQTECKACYVNGVQVAAPGRPCNNWPCVMGRCFRQQLVPLLDDEHASLAKLKLESRLLLTPSSLAFVSTYIRPLLRTRRRLESLLKVKQEEAFQTEASSAKLTQQNRMKQQHSHMVDKFVEWVLCGGPVRHIVGFRIFEFFVFPPDSLVEIAGHTDAQRVYFWRQASSNIVPRNPVDFPRKLSGGPLLSFFDALELGRNNGNRTAEHDGGVLQSPDVFFAAARYIHSYEKGVQQKDLEASITFVDHLAEVIARHCMWTAEKIHLKDSEMYQKFFVESWDILRPVSMGTSAAIAQQPRSHSQSYGHQNASEGGQPISSESNGHLSRTLQTLLTVASPNLQGALIPSDLFDWQTRLLQKQRNAILRHVDTALLSLPKEWLEGSWTISRVVEEQSPIWRWSPDEEETKQQQELNQATQAKRKAEEKDRKMKESKELRKRLEMEALESSKRIRQFR